MFKLLDFMRRCETPAGLDVCMCTLVKNNLCGEAEGV